MPIRNESGCVVYLELLEAGLRCLHPLAVLDLIVGQELQEVEELDTITQLGAQVGNVHLALAEMLIATGLKLRNIGGWVHTTKQ